MIASANSSQPVKFIEILLKTEDWKKSSLFKQEWFPLARYRDESLPTLSFKSHVNKIGPDNTPYFLKHLFLRQPHISHRSVVGSLTAIKCKSRERNEFLLPWIQMAILVNGCFLNWIFRALLFLKIGNIFLQTTVWTLESIHTCLNICVTSIIVQTNRSQMCFWQFYRTQNLELSHGYQSFCNTCLCSHIYHSIQTPHNF